MDWFRVYNSIKDDPKILQFSPENRWYFVALLAVSSEEEDRGTLPSMDLLAIALRIKKSKVLSLLTAFVEAGLIDQDPATKRLTVHGWDKRQRRSDDANVRQKTRRERIKSREEEPRLSRDKTAPRVRATDTETDTETENTPLVSPPDRGGGTRPERDDRRVVDREAGTPTLAVDRHEVADRAAERWGSQGLDTAESLLNLYRPEAVAYAAEETFAEHGQALTLQAVRLWKKICREHPDGPPPPRPRLRRWEGEPQAKPQTDHQRKMAAAMKLGAQVQREIEEEERRNQEHGHAAVS